MPRVLDSLRFEGMTERDERIPSPYPDTFEWLFTDIGFLQWLQTQNK